MEQEKFIIKNALEFSNEERNKFKKIVLSKGEVTEQTFDGLLKKNPIILFYPNTDNIEGVGALKIPNESYKSKVFAKSETKLKPTEFEYELGWIVSLKPKKGIGTLITKKLFNLKPNIYSTVRTQNIGMNKIMKIVGFEKTGLEYKSERGDYNNLLYIKTK